MKKILIVILMLVLAFNELAGQKTVSIQYRRSSLYSILLVDTSQKMCQEIINSFVELPVPDKFNDHNLCLRYVIATKKQQKGKNLDDNLSEFFRKNNVPKRLVAKWFDRDKQNGSFDISTILQRGYYNASISDLDAAVHTVRGRDILSDAGEQLIGNTFVIVNNISYVDKEQGAEAAAQAFKVIGSVLGAIGGVGGSIGESVGNLAQTIAQTIAGFTVRVNTSLYRLEWNDEIASAFYSQYYYDKSNVDKAKKQAFEDENGLFKLNYVGSVSAISDQTVMRGLYHPKDVFRKVLARAIDKNIVALQKKFDEFKVVVPIYKLQDNKVMVQIGMKEGVSNSSRYEVLEIVQNENGRYTYVRKGVIKPVDKKIWDNRYMAVDEEADNADLNYTTFEVVSGSDFYPGMLIREIKYSSGM